MKTIWKFELGIEDRRLLEIPIGAEVLAVQVQGSTPCMWALVDPDAEREVRDFIMCGTGHVIPDVELKHLGTYQLYSGNFVGHVFEVVG